MRTANKYIINDIYIHTYTNAQIKHEIETVFAHEYDTRNLCMIYIELCVNFFFSFLMFICVIERRIAVVLVIVLNILILIISICHRRISVCLFVFFELICCCQKNRVLSRIDHAQQFYQIHYGHSENIHFQTVIHHLFVCLIIRSFVRSVLFFSISSTCFLFYFSVEISFHFEQFFFSARFIWLVVCWFPLITVCSMLCYVAIIDKNE